jgi:O-antigen/teichoic acid export membrane protein
MGFGIYSLVYSYLAGVTTATFLIIIAGLKFHKPAFHFRFHEIKKFLSFGIYQTADSIVNYFNSQFDTIIIGKVLGIIPLGIYNMAKNLSMRPAQVINPIITQVSYPLMAKVQHDESQVKAIYLRTINYLSSCNFVIYLFMCVMAKPIILVCFGSKWDSAVLILQLLSIYAMIRSIINPIGTLLLTKGKVKQQFYWNLILLAILPATIYLGSLFGLTGVALASIFSILGMLFAAWRFLVYPNCHATFAQFFAQLTGPILVGTCLVILLVLVNLIPIDNSILQLSIAGTVTAVVIIPLNKVFNKSYYLEMMRILTSVLNRFKKKST